MDKHQDSAPLALIVVPLLYLVLIIGLLSAFPDNAFAHEFDPETWIEMRKMSRVKGPTPTIEADVAALAGGDAKRAGPRLIDRGPEVLPAVHAALGSTGIEPRHGLRLLQVMSAVGEESSVPVVIELLESDKNTPLRRDALYILALLPATDESAELMVTIARNDNEKWNTRRMAYTWFGLQRDPRGQRFAEALRTEPDPEKRTAGLYVLARLGDKTVLEPVSQLLASGATANTRDTLMMALAEITTPEVFERRAPATLAWSRGYKESHLYARYRATGSQEKIPLCLEMLRSQTPGHRELAVRCLLENGHASDLRPHAALDLEVPGRAALIRNDIRKAGWRIIDTDDEFNIVPGDPVKNLP